MATKATLIEKKGYKKMISYDECEKFNQRLNQFTPEDEKVNFKWKIIER